jgi:prepilin-type N-terminal cleavage/methylation domain-containing protein
MNILSVSQIGPPRRVARAFTLVEMMTAVGVFALLAAAVVATQMFAFRIYTLSANRLIITSDGRHVMDQIRDAIREAKTLYVGNCANGFPGSFVIAANLQSGNALQVFPSTNAAVYVIYYLDDSNAVTNYLKAFTVPASGQRTIITLASGMTNKVIFYAEDYQGFVLTNNADNRVIKALLQFMKQAYAGTGTVRSAYQLRTWATQRILN